jgi:hypothetical protein
MKAFWVKMFGWAADHIVVAVWEKGTGLVAPTKGFLVKSGRRPLMDGELEKAKAWGKEIAEAAAGERDLTGHR